MNEPHSPSLFEMKSEFENVKEKSILPCLPLLLPV